MAHKVVPVHMGSPRYDVLEAGAFRVTDAWFPADEILPPHHHDRPVLGIMLSGSFDDVFGGRTSECAPSTVFTEPAGERHANRIQRAGAHVLVIQPDPREGERLRPASALWESIQCFPHGPIADRAHRLGREVRSPDSITSLAAEALVLEILAAAARLEESGRRAGEPPRWLLEARDLIHARFRERLRVDEVAAAVDVHPVRLARRFRETFHLPLGDYVRRLRLEWATTQVVETEESLSAIALRAGYADQSHFTREFRKRTGVPPGRYRGLQRTRE